MAERAGLENRRWGNLSASSNLAPSAINQQVAEPLKMGFSAVNPSTVTGTVTFFA